MNLQDIQITTVQPFLEKWEKELNDIGYISDEKELLKRIKTINEEHSPTLSSHLLTLAALSRIGKTHKRDSLVKTWMEKAIKLNPSNKRATAFLAQDEWNKKKELIDLLVFPTIRETDNRQAKKKTAEQIIAVCKTFLEGSEEQLENLERVKKDASLYQDKDLHGRYVRLIALLKEVIEETSEALKAAEEYDESITGVFYTSTHYQRMKSHLDQLEKLKSKWDEQFSFEEATTVVMNPLEELDQMVGLNEVKTRVNNFYKFLKYQKNRKSLGFQTKDEIDLHMILTGNPGTGKTTLARLLAKIYHELGVLPREEVIEADRTQLVGAFVGQTEENVRAVVEKALGGVLFIDEAYSLKREGQTGSDYGQTAIDTLVSLMTGKEYGGKFAVILAGYPEEMRQFLEANPGLRSRFPQSNHIHLSDYTNEELLQIADKLASDNDYVMTDEAKTELSKRLEKERVDETFGNARTVKNIVLDAIFKKGSGTLSVKNIIDYTLLEREDFYIENKQELEDPRTTLDHLIGLDSIKEEVNILASFVRMQQMRREKGLPVVPIQLHSVFTGNPGTGKTTVAKIYAGLLKECGMLKRGHLIVASRADFVAGYVGQTAIKTKKKIREALGGVLFIDEAYSLFSQTSGDFGKEVIDTLVDEMTKHNENLVVILAGYPNEMELLLQSNPGLKSRFKKFFFFPDYTTSELIEIMEQYAAKYQYELSQEAKDLIVKELNDMITNGNGRFATNLMDDAIQAQALRMMESQAEFELTDGVSIIEVTDVHKGFQRIRKEE